MHYLTLTEKEQEATLNYAIESIKRKFYETNNKVSCIVDAEEMGLKDLVAEFREYVLIELRGDMITLDVMINNLKSHRFNEQTKRCVNHKKNPVMAALHGYIESAKELPNGAIEITLNDKF